MNGGNGDDWKEFILCNVMKKYEYDSTQRVNNFFNNLVAPDINITNTGATVPNEIFNQLFDESFGDSFGMDCNKK